MADNALSDFFAKKGKKKIKSSNLNNESANPKVEEKKIKPKEKEEEGWEEEQILAPTMRVEVAGKLMREDEKKEDEDVHTQKWKMNKVKGGVDQNRKGYYPSLTSAVGQSSNINLDDGSEPKVNIKTTKNAFAALNENDDDEEELKRPKEIKPAMVQKQKGERATVAIQREVDKYSKGDKKSKAEGGKKKRAELIEDESDDDDVDDDKKVVKSKKKKDVTKQYAQQAEAASKSNFEDGDDIPVDDEATRAKYRGRAKLPFKDIPASEKAEERQTNLPSNPQSGKKKRFVNMMDDEDGKPKLAYWDEDTNVAQVN